jgi:hypothetical protein
MSRTVYQDKEIYDEFKEIINRAFGIVKFEGGGNVNGEHYRLDLASCNFNYRDTEYYYAKPLQFFHLTGLGFLFSVLSSRAFRMYDLHSSADEQEYGYAAKAMGINDEAIHDLKSRLYTLSFCPTTEMDNPYIWEKYGQGGAAIVFEIVNGPEQWINYNLGEIKYKLPSGLENYQSELDAFKKKHGITAYFDASRLIGFYKMDHFREEREVRLLRYAPYGNQSEYTKYVKHDYRFDKIHKRNRLTTYIDLPLWVDNERVYDPIGYEHLSIMQQLPEEYFKRNPQIKIVDVRVWDKCGLTDADFEKVKQQIKDMALFTLGYQINVSENFFHCQTEK